MPVDDSHASERDIRQRSPPCCSHCAQSCIVSALWSAFGRNSVSKLRRSAIPRPRITFAQSIPSRRSHLPASVQRKDASISTRSGTPSRASTITTQFNSTRHNTSVAVLYTRAVILRKRFALQRFDERDCYAAINLEKPSVLTLRERQDRSQKGCNDNEERKSVHSRRLQGDRHPSFASSPSTRLYLPTTPCTIRSSESLRRNSSGQTPSCQPS